MTKYQMDEDVWWARFEATESWIPCPDCGQTRFLTMILFDGSTHTLDCETCKRGWDGPFGKLRVYERAPFAILTRIIGVSMDRDKVEYRVPDSYVVPETELFKTQEEALKRARVRADEATQAELEQLTKKERDTKSWAWHVTYHRNGKRQNEKEAARHAAKLDVAKSHTKKNTLPSGTRKENDTDDARHSG